MYQSQYLRDNIHGYKSVKSDLNHIKTLLIILVMGCSICIFLRHPFRAVRWELAAGQIIGGCIKRKDFPNLNLLLLWLLCLYFIDLINAVMNDFSVSTQFSNGTLTLKWLTSTLGAGEDRAEEEATQLENRG